VTPRKIALALGVIFAVLTVVELVAGDWSPGGLNILDRTTRANLLHWALALVMIGSFYAGSEASRLACRVVGIVLLALAAWGLLSAATLGTVLGYSDGIPASYQVLHLLTAVAAIGFGFGARARKA
jgi:hypothetical protein